MRIEVNSNCIDQTPTLGIGKQILMLTPPIGEDYWLFRVHLHSDQYVQAFPKFGIIGIGFAQEEDWNTNFPSDCTAQKICKHIWHNHKYDKITKEQVIEAIEMLQAICARWKQERASKGA